MVNHPTLVEVHWEDHYSLGDDWYKPGHHHEPCVLVAIGYLVAEDDMYYYVTSTYEPATRQYSAGTAVLKKCVTEFYQLERKSGRTVAVQKTKRRQAK